jgi:hypothetical protein
MAALTTISLAAPSSPGLGAYQAPSKAQFLVSRWLQAVREHTPGELDRSAIEIGKWTRRELETVVSNLDRLSHFVLAASELKARDPVAWQQNRDAANSQRSGRFVIRIGDEQLTLDDVGRMFDGNRTLRSGAVLHADIAMHGAGRVEHRVVVVEDGRGKGQRDAGIHWGIGRLVLDSIVPNPKDDPTARIWYRAASAFLLNDNDFAELFPHLEKARQVFPDDPGLLLDAAYVQEKLSSPELQAGVDDLRERGVTIATEPPATQLYRAEQLFARVVALAPDEVDAHLRRGRALAELGRHEESAAVLRRLLERDLDKDRRYLAELFLGRAEATLGRAGEAARRYENAAALYPDAQSPRMALSQLARAAGDRVAALRHLAPVLERVNDDPSIDPWWGYFEPHAKDVDDWLAAMRKLAEPERPNR